jgi:hypothetical protein
MIISTAAHRYTINFAGLIELNGLLYVFKSFQIFEKKIKTNKVF